MTEDGGERSRLIAERAAADRRYNEKLTAVDAAVRPAAPVPPGPAALAARDLSPLEKLSAVVPPEPPKPRGLWRTAMRRIAWEVIGPILQRQQAFNTAIVEQLKQDAKADREASAAVAGAVATNATILRDELEALATFESQLTQYLQQVTPFVDTKMRVLEHAMEELRMSAAAAQRASSAVKREIERLRADGMPAARSGEAPVATAAAEIDSYKYVGFEDCFRGSPEDIRARLTDYASYFAGASDVLDVGCGRGEFLDLLKTAGVRARGVDTNHEMVEICRARGLNVEQADALSYLRAQADESLGGLLAAQVVEHLEPQYLMQFLETAHQKLRPGALLVLETINPACWVAFFESYIRDITHVRPLHPDTLKYLVVASGFHDVNVQFRAPIEEAGKLERLAAPAGGAAAGANPVAELTRAFNANMDRLNERMFTYLDYAIIAKR
jgi:2-polyprenyl-3-methyl-5-hydroxy-6-metoxy-1,4-benzoquinol methylase